MRTAPNKSDALVLDHAGNCGRFWDEWNDLFEVGVRELDDGKPKPKKAEKKKEQGPQKCPSCNRLHQPMPFCPHCGHEYPKRASVEHVPGTLKELVATGNKAAMSNVLWPQVVRYALDKRGDAGRGMALALYKQITGQWPKGEFEDTKPAAVISPEVRAKITSLNIAWAKARASKAPSEAPA